MFDTLLLPGWVPFTLACALLFALLALELLFALIGFSMLGGGDADLDLDADLPDIGDVDIDVDADLGDYEIPDMAEGAEIEADAPAGALAWLGMGRVPFMIWLASLLLGFSVSGFVLQSAVLASLGFVLPPFLAILPAGVAGIWFARQFGALFAAILPKSESTAMSTRRYAGHQGVVTQGTARAGHPAEVRITDRHGNLHYLRAEPLEAEARLSAGIEVLVLRNRSTGQFKITALTRQ